MQAILSSNSPDWRQHFGQELESKGGHALNKIDGLGVVSCKGYNNISINCRKSESFSDAFDGDIFDLPFLDLEDVHRHLC